jgi:hypothetical protein
VQLEEKEGEAWREEDGLGDEAVVYRPFVEEDAG